MNVSSVPVPVRPSVCPTLRIPISKNVCPSVLSIACLMHQCVFNLSLCP